MPNTVLERRKRTKKEKEAEIKRLVENSPAFLVMKELIGEVDKQRSVEENANARINSTMEAVMRSRGRIEAYDSIYSLLDAALKKAVQA